MFTHTEWGSLQDNEYVDQCHIDDDTGECRDHWQKGWNGARGVDNKVIVCIDVKRLLIKGGKDHWDVVCFKRVEKMKIFRLVVGTQLPQRVFALECHKDFHWKAHIWWAAQQ